MSETRAPDSEYHVEIRDGRGVVIGDNNVVYQYFLDERYRPLAEHLITFDDLIAERTADFVGRAFLDARLAAFMSQHDRGYFVLVGEPGIGKTAWAGHVVREYQALHHFNVSAMGIVRPDQCLENLCAQIIARFQLDQPFLPVNAGRDGSLLDKLLRQAAGKLDGRKLVIAIDALDEAQMPADMRGANALYLPTSLPAGIYCVLTRRPQPTPLETAPGTPSETFTLGAELPDNQTDVRAYLRQQAGRPEFVARLTEQRIPTERFVEELAERSAGNFMYLAYLLPDIAAGLFAPLHLTGLPQGLRGYYERFWNELETAKGEGREAWTKFYKPVIGMLAAAREPVSAAWIGRILGLEPDEVTDFALARWRKFLYRVDVADEARWRLYHASFADFLAEKLESAKCYHDRIADYYQESRDGNWFMLKHIDDAYGLRHLVMHFAGAGRWRDLHNLVTKGRDDHLVWAEARHSLDGTYGGYLADLTIAWKHSDEEVMNDETAMGRQLHYALIKSSVHSLAAGVSPELLAALVQYKVPDWTPSSALSYCRAIPDEQQRADCIAVLAPTLDADLLCEALLAAEALEWAGARVRAFSGLIPHLPHDQREAILNQALADASSIRHEPEHTHCRILLLPFLPAEVQFRRSRSLLHHIAAENTDWDRATSLELLAPRLSPALHADALDIAQSIENEQACAHALVALASHLPQELVSWAYSAAENLESEYPRWLALAALAPRLSVDARDAAIRQVLEAAQELEEPFQRPKVLEILVAHSGAALLESGGADMACALIEHQESDEVARPSLSLLPDMSSDLRQGVLVKALDSAQIIADDSQQAEVLASLLPHLPSDVRQEAITRISETARNSEWEDDCIRLLAAAVPFLDRSERERRLEDLLKRAESILENDLDAGGMEGIAKVLPYLDRELQRRFIERSLQAVRGMWRAELRARSLCALIPALPPAARKRTIDELLNLAANIKNEYERAEIFSGLLPYLPKRGLNWVLSAVQKMRNEPARVEVLAKMASNPPADLISKVLACAKTINDEDDRFRVFCALGHYPHARNASDALAQAMASARLWWEAEPRARDLENLVPAWLRLIREDRSESLRLFTSLLHQMAARSRYDLLSDLRVFTPVVVALAGPEAAISAAKGILDVGQWWP